MVILNWAKLLIILQLVDITLLLHYYYQKDICYFADHMMLLPGFDTATYIPGRIYREKYIIYHFKE